MIVIARPFALYFETQYRPVRLLRKTAGHVTQMRLTMDRLDDCFGGAVTPQTATQDDVDRFRVWRSQLGTAWYCAAPTLNKDLRNWRAVQNYCCRRGHRGTMLWFEFEQELLPEPIAWYPEELEAIFASCAEETGWVGGLPAALFWKSLAGSLYSTGARIGVVMRCPLAAFDPTHGCLALSASHQKHRRGSRPRLHCKTIELLTQSIRFDPARAMLFPWPYDRNATGWPTLTAHWKRILTRAGLPSDRWHLFHCMRKTTATRVRQHGTLADARAAMEHSSESVTMRYVDTRQICGSSAAEKTPEPRFEACIPLG